jgi:methylated-DNA-[protein]-cysteine S-methyltransferase
VKTSWGIVAYIARDNKLVKLFLPPELPLPSLSKGGEKKQAQFHRTEIEEFARKRKTTIEEDPDLLPGLAKQLGAYFEGKPVRFDCDYDLGALPLFTKKVVLEISKIPYGKTVSYRQIAQKAGKPYAFRATGQAVGNNPIPIVIPCHRILRSDGKLGGFTAHCGVALKEKLLELEKTNR